jgi:hypothetical protein
MIRISVASTVGHLLWLSLTKNISLCERKKSLENIYLIFIHFSRSQKYFKFNNFHNIDLKFINHFHPLRAFQWSQEHIPISLKFYNLKFINISVIIYSIFKLLFFCCKWELGALQNHMGATLLI